MLDETGKSENSVHNKTDNSSESGESQDSKKSKSVKTNKTNTLSKKKKNDIFRRYYDTKTNPLDQADQSSCSQHEESEGKSENKSDANFFFTSNSNSDTDNKISITHLARKGHTDVFEAYANVNLKHRQGDNKKIKHDSLSSYRRSGLKVNNTDFLKDYYKLMTHRFRSSGVSMKAKPGTCCFSDYYKRRKRR